MPAWIGGPDAFWTYQELKRLFEPMRAALALSAQERADILLALRVDTSPIRDADDTDTELYEADKDLGRL